MYSICKNLYFFSFFVELNSQILKKNFLQIYIVIKYFIFCSSQPFLYWCLLILAPFLTYSLTKFKHYIVRNNYNKIY